MAFIPQVTMAINFIPIEALSGLLLYLFASVALSKMHDTHANTRNEEIVGILGLSAFFLAPHVFPNISQIAVGMLTMIFTYVVLLIVDKSKK
jgi:multisubunit Na+/H+ antiporter MnhG subunit